MLSINLFNRFTSIISEGIINQLFKYLCIPIVHYKSSTSSIFKTLRVLKYAEQYVLVVRRADWYPCYHCKEDAAIFLTQGEVWKYGVTQLGKPGGSERYPEGLPFSGLLYVPQFQGTLQECLKEAKRKIHYYTLLPENVNRKEPLARPPGNKNEQLCL